MQLTCKNCGALIPARSINVQTMTAVCEACDAVFTFDAHELPTGKKTKRLKIKQPPGYTTTDTPEGVQLEIRWRRAMGSLEWVALGLFLAGAVSFTGFGTIALAEGSLLGGGILSLVAGLFWYLVAMFPINRTTYTLDDEALTVRHRPLWYPGVTVEREAVEGVKLATYEGSSSYQTVKVTLADGSEKVIDHYPSEQAVYIKHALESALRLPEPPPPPLPPLAGERLRVGADGELVPIDDGVATDENASPGIDAIAPDGAGKAAQRRA